MRRWFLVGTFGLLSGAGSCSSEAEAPAAASGGASAVGGTPSEAGEGGDAGGGARLSVGGTETTPQSDGGDSGSPAQHPGGGATSDGGQAGAAGESGRSDGGALGDAGDAGQASVAGGVSAPDCVDPLKLPLLREAPRTLAETGLYTSGSAAPGNIAAYVRPFQPHYELWSDGAEKHRFAYLPACTQIDTTDMDYWKFPVGVRFWKEFRRDGTLVETRFIHRFGPGENDWLFAPYQWDVGELTPDKALRVDDGMTNVNGTPHDIPSRRDCAVCHGNLPEPPLAFSAIQLSHSLPGVTLRALSEEGALTEPATRDYVPPGSAREQAGLGYLHANCGHCHNSYYRTEGLSWPEDPSPRFRLSVNDLTVESTTLYTTLVSVRTFNPAYRDYNRIEPCNPGLSSTLLRMLTRTDGPMPPLATELVDQTGVETVRAFLRYLHAPGVAECPG